MNTRVLLLAVLSGCGPGRVDDTSGESESGGAVVECTAPRGWPETPIDCRPIECSLDIDHVDQPLTCTVVLNLAEGHVGAVSLGISGVGEVPWHEPPWAADADPWATGPLVGAGIECGLVSVNTSSIRAVSGERFVDVVCVDDSLALFDFSRVYLTPNGAAIEP